MSFIAYPHLERLGKEDVEGIVAGDCYIFPKIDGTNGSVWVEQDDVGLAIRCGSRNRELTTEADNAGFLNTMISYNELRDFFNKYPNLRLYGEWLVPHTFKGYRADAWRKFYVFDAAEARPDIDGTNALDFLKYEEYKPLLDEFGIEYIPCQKIIKNPSDEELKHEMDNNFYLSEGGTPGEGIVIKNYDYKNKWGRLTFAKLVREEFKEGNLKAFGSPEGGTKKVEEDIITKYITLSALPEKTYNKIINDNIENLAFDKSKCIPRVLETVYHELIQEETWNFTKVFNNPTINFKLLRALCLNETKKKLPQLFL